MFKNVIHAFHHATAGDIFLQFSSALKLALSAVFAVFIPITALAESNRSGGGFAVASGEYKFPPTVDTDILANVTTEIWARVFWPEDLSRPRPIIFLLHGNHSTCGMGDKPHTDSDCSYTVSGKCPAGMQVVPNHEGYNYFAADLASFGYIVVSINANRGITCGDSVEGDMGLVLARGRLILKHIETWYRWATKGGVPAELGAGDRAFVGAVDFSNVGLMGHSRGGEGVRAAYNLYRDKNSSWKTKIPKLEIRGIFEIGAVDGQSNRVLDADNAAWNQLLPMCDGDVSDLQGRKPFERMLLKRRELRPTPKSLYMVWGANHNFFNSEWQGNDSRGCYGHEPIYGDSYFSLAQQKIAHGAMLHFFLGNVGKQARAALATHFDPRTPLPTWETKLTHVDRDYLPTFDQAFSVRLEDFSQPTGTSCYKIANTARGIKIEHDGFDLPTRAAISWENAGNDVLAQFNWTRLRRGKALTGLETLDFRVARQDEFKGIAEPTDFSVALVDPNNHLSKVVSLSRFAPGLIGPANLTTTYQTARIPLAAFNLGPKAKIRGVRFIFNASRKGAIYLASVRFSAPVMKPAHLPLGDGNAFPETSPAVDKRFLARLERPSRLIESRAEFAGSDLRFDSRGPTYAGRVSAVDISVRAPERFPVSDELPALFLGDRRFLMSRFGADGSTAMLTFKVPYQDLKDLPESGPSFVQIGSGALIRRWRLPDFKKSQFVID